MIDISTLLTEWKCPDKYEGTWKIHGMEYWKYSYKGQCEADTNLIHDAPLLLEEVKRLRKLLAAANERARLAIESHPNADEMLKELIE